jgi:phosphohistidine phosphatase
MDLILWRHAEAEDGVPDLGRRLTEKGRKQARRVAEWLDAHLPQSATILVSPATRARETADALAALSRRPLEVVEGLEPDGSVDGLLAAAGWPGAETTVVVVGHQPTLGSVASLLLAGSQRSWAIKKGGAWWFRSRERYGDEQTVLRAVVNPDLL